MQKVDVIFPDRVVAASEHDTFDNWTFIKWTVRPGDTVYRGQQLAVLKSSVTGAVDHVVAPRAGTLQRLALQNGADITEANVHVAVAVIEFCPHSVVFRGICALCGSDVDVVHFAEETPATNRNSGNVISVGYDEKFLTVSRHVAKSVSASTAEILLRHRKLALVLDLDHTLVHATADLRAMSMLVHSPKTDDVNLKSVVSFSLPDRQSQQPSLATGLKFPLIIPGSPSMHLKLRPNLKTFLERVSSIFQLHIYTMGSRPYADQVARIIDPDNCLFHGRVTSREDFAEGAWNRKKLERLFPCDDSLAVIVDDREDVWIAGNQDNSLTFMPNLVRAAPYFFWNGLEEVYDCTSPTNKTHVPPSHRQAFLPPVAPDGNLSPTSSFSLKLSETTNANGTIKHSPTENLNTEKENGDKAEISETDDQEDGNAEKDTATIDNADFSDKSGSAKNVRVNSETEAQEREMRKTVKEMWDKDVDPEAGKHLLRLAEILEECHRRYFDKASTKLKSSLTNISIPESQSIADTTGADVKEILSGMRSEVLRGCVITFSGVIPLQVNPENAPIWKLAIRLGAECLRIFTKGRTTHMVMPENRRTNTVKYEEALRSGCTFLVTTKWLDDCAINFERREEFKYRVNDTAANKYGQGWEDQDSAAYQWRIRTNFERARSESYDCVRGKVGSKAQREVTGETGTDWNDAARKKARLSTSPRPSNGYANGGPIEQVKESVFEDEEVREEELEAELNAIFDDDDDDDVDAASVM